jgi:tetratricopeptide (TPR) repeat protein
MSLLTADVELLARDAEAAERDLRVGYEALERMGERGLLSAVAAQLGRALCAQERYNEAERFAQVSQELARSDDVAAQMLWRTTRAKVLARRQLLEEAESLAHQAREITEKTDALNSRGLSLTTLAEVLLLAGREEEAAPLLGQALKLFERKGNVVAATSAREMLANLSKRNDQPKTDSPSRRLILPLRVTEDEATS